MTNLMQPSTGDFLSIGKFDKEIAAYLETKQHLAKACILDSEKPEIIEALRMWLVKNVGCFDIIGQHFRVVNLSTWFDYEGLIEEFDELLLTFRDWLNLQFHLITTDKYNLLRYMRPDTFICFTGEVPSNLIPPPLYVEEEFLDHDVQEVIGHIEQFEQLLHDKLSCNFDVTRFFKEVFPEDQLPEIIQRYLV